MSGARVFRAPAAAALLVASGGCFDPTFDNPTCGPNGECPSGTSCVQNVCRASADDTDATIDMAASAIDAPTDAAIDAPGDGTPNDGAPNDGSTQCPSGDLQSPTDSSRCFRKLPNQAPWNGARNSCQTLGFDLADIRNGQENQLVGNLASGEGGLGVWIAGSDMMIEMEWRWVNTNALIMGASFQAWAGGEPNGAGGPNDDCMRIDQTGQWFDSDCSGQARKAICLTRPI